MNKYNFDQKVNRRQFHSSKWNYDEGVISLTIADTDFTVPNEVREAVESISKYGRFGYTDTCDTYFESYIDWYSSRYHASFKKEDCLFATGIVASIDSILKRITKPNDKVLMLTPVYNVFFNCIKNNKCELLEVPFIYKDGKVSINYPLFEKCIKEVKVFIFCNPHNPTGYRFLEEEVNYFNEKCLENDVYFLSDEIHSDIDYNIKRYHSTLVENISSPKLITFLSPGKTFNLAGLHSSIVVIKNKELREEIQKGLYMDDIGEPSIFSIDPVIAAYKYGEDYVYELNEYLLNNKQLVSSYLSINLPKLKLVDSEMTYLLWIDISSYNTDSKSFAEYLLKEAKVAVAPGINYGDDCFIRINIATQFDTLKEALERIKIALDNL